MTNDKFSSDSDSLKAANYISEEANLLAYFILEPFVSNKKVW